MRPRDKRALIAGGAVALLAILGTQVVPGVWRSVGEGRSEAQRGTELLARLRLEVDRTAVLEDSGSKIRAKVVALAPKILAGNGPAEALAALTGRVTAVAAAQRVRLERTSPLEDSTGLPGLRRVSLRVAVIGDSRGTLNLIGALAQGPVVLSTDGLSIVASNASASNDVAEALQTEFTVRGWYQPRERRR
jgi:type II secretion system (T2SS) protein M